MPSFVPSQPLYVAVADKLEKLIRAGTLRPGERIPSVRRTCAQHSVSLTTSVQAYLLLENRGLIEARPKSGFFVRLQLRNLVQEPQPSRPAPTVLPVTVGSLQSRIFDAARMPAVAPLGAAYPGAANLPTAKLSRIMSVVARKPERRASITTCRPARKNYGGKSPGARWTAA